jgi:hypothetical protein
VWFAANTETIWVVADAFRADVGTTEPSPEQSNPESPPPAQTDGAGPEILPAAEAVDAGPPAPEFPIDSPAAPEPPTIAIAPPIVPMHPGETALAAAVGNRDAAIRGAATAAHRAGRQSASRHWQLPRPGLSTAILALVAIYAALIAWRTDVVRFAPQTAPLYAAIGLPVNLRGLVFSNVTTEIDTSDGVPVMVVTGTIASAARRVVEVPRLRFAIRNDNGHEIYTWTTPPPKNALAPGAALAFRSRLASPPHEAREVLVRFFNRRDRVAGLQ